MSSPPADTEASAELRFRRWPALLFSAIVIGATGWPALRDPPRDSFPLSTYPMFSTVREAAWIHVVVGFDGEGRERAIPPSMIANAEVMQAAQTIAIAVGKWRARGLCAEVAERVARAPRYADVVRLEVQSRKLDPLTYFSDPDGDEPARVRRRAACEVPR
jgi:hypothetical protein